MSGKLQISDLAISIVEPSSTQARVIRQQLHDIGVTRVDHFKQGGAALGDMRKYRPDLIVSAMHLPDMTGNELIQAMRADDELEGIPFMLISSEVSDYYLEPMRQAGVIAILPKPFQAQDLTRALYSTLEFIEPDPSLMDEIELDELSVLVVDDSATARKHICRVLNNLGMNEITQAVNGKEAVDILSRQFFDLIVTDYNMPEMDGQELTRHIRQHSHQRTIPILMVTSEANHSHLAGVKQSGVSALCDKPFEPGEVKSLIRKMMCADSGR